MRIRSVSLFCRVLRAALVTLAVLLVPVPALAFGSIQLKSANIDEVDGRWKLEMDVNYGGAPHMGHIPFDFVFTLTSYYEYSITDQDREPQIRPKPMHEQPPQRESVDIDFADARGKIWPRTKFQIALKRDRGFEAGEYKLVIRRSSDNAQLGQPINLRLNGKNKLVDRRAMVFGAPTGKKGADAGAGAGDSDGGSESAEKAAEPSAESKPKDPEPETNAPPPVEPRPGSHGCGCRMSDTSGIPPLTAVAMLGMGIIIWKGRSKRR